MDKSPQIGIWALENYLDFFNAVIDQRTDEIDKTTNEAQSVFMFTDPKLRWISYVRLGLLYEKLGNETKKDESFQKATEIFGRKVKEGKVDDFMIKVVEGLDKDFEPFDFEAEQ
ncbi:MAG: hypothetical protein J7K65_05530 [Planctomycetes bacterium]|nr:hypothetical protein [Planctomycetota bacterium]